MYSVLVSIALNAIVLKYVLENEQKNCECALTWHHRFIKFYAPILIFMLFVNLLFKNEMQRNKNKMLVKVPLGIIGLVSLVYSITLIVYFFRLHLKECKCAEDWKRFALIAPLVIFLIVLLFLVLLSLFLRK